MFGTILMIHAGHVYGTILLQHEKSNSMHFKQIYNVIHNHSSAIIFMQNQAGLTKTFLICT